MTKAGLFYRNIKHLLKNRNNVHIMLNDSQYPIPQVEEKKKQYTTSDVNRADHARRL